MSDNESNHEEEVEDTGLEGEQVKGLSDRKIRKNKYWAKLESALHEYKNILVIGVDFVGSSQMQQVRMALRGKAVIVMGKNTIMRKVIRDNIEKNPALEGLLQYIYGNIGFVFTNESNLNDLRKKIQEFVVPAAAKSGVVAPVNVVVPAGPTGLDPGQTSFFQTLNISTKISRGTIEITNDVKLCTAGEKVSASAVALLSKLNIRPFEFGIKVNNVYENGSIYDAKVLDLSSDDLCSMFAGAACRLAAISFQIGQINQATVPHSFGRAFRTLCAIAITTGYDFAELEAVKEAMANPGAGAGAADGGKAAAKAPEPEEEEEEEAAPAMDMFGAGGEEEAADY